MFIKICQWQNSYPYINQFQKSQKDRPVLKCGTNLSKYRYCSCAIIPQRKRITVRRATEYQLNIRYPKLHGTLHILHL